MEKKCLSCSVHLAQLMFIGNLILVAIVIFVCYGVC